MAGGAVDWASKRQGMVTISTTESEYVEGVDSGKAIMWARNFFEELGIPVQQLCSSSGQES